MRVLNLFAGAILASVGFAQTIAQDVANIPTCAINCLSPAIEAAGCGQTDWACICGAGKATVKANAFSCIIASCNVSEALTTQQLAGDICTLTLGGNSTSSQISSSTSTQSSTTTSAPSSITSISSTNNTSSTSSSSFSTTSTSTVVLISTVPPTGVSTSTASPSPEPKPGLRRKANIGIAVGAVLGGLFFIVLIALVMFGYQKRRRDLKHLAAMAIAGEKQPPSNGPHELSGESYVHEAPSTTEVQNTGSEEIGKAVGGNEPAEVSVAAEGTTPSKPVASGG